MIQRNNLSETFNTINNNPCLETPISVLERDTLKQIDFFASLNAKHSNEKLLMHKGMCFMIELYWPRLSGISFFVPANHETVYSFFLHFTVSAQQERALSKFETPPNVVVVGFHLYTILARLAKRTVLQSSRCFLAILIVSRKLQG